MSTATALPNEKRVENYRFQEINRTRQVVTDSLTTLEAKLTGKEGRPLSSRQERRRQKHENRAKGGYPQDAPMEKFVEVGPPISPYDEIADVVMDFVGTPEESPAARPCGGTVHCITPKGAKAKQTHVKCKAADAA